MGRGGEEGERGREGGVRDNVGCGGEGGGARGVMEEEGGRKGGSGVAWREVARSLNFIYLFNFNFFNYFFKFFFLMFIYLFLMFLDFYNFN